jgi:thiaminase
MSFCAAQIQAVQPLWDRMLSHPFLVGTRDGTLPDEVFARWMRQDYLFVEAAIPFMAALLAKAPEKHREPLSGVIAALQKELALFEERARAVGVSLREGAPSFACHAYIQFLMATAYQRSYAEGYTVLYAAEKAYHDSWKVVRAGLRGGSPWMPFVENWAGEEFAAYVQYLESELDLLAGAVGEEERRHMADLFELTTRYEIAFWEMASSGETWPGLD